MPLFIILKTIIMGKFQKAIVSFTKERDAAIIPLCEFIIASITGNAFFPTPVPAPTAIQTTLDDYTQALADAASRDRNKVALKNQLRNQLNGMLNQLGNYVNTTSSGDVTMIISSGFQLSKLPQPRYVSVPGNPTVKPGINPGTLVTKVKADAAAAGYTFMIAMASTKDDYFWTSTTTSRSQYEFTDLMPRTEYVVKVVVIGSKDQVVYSGIVNQFTM